MLRVAKREGFGNVVVEEAPVPDVGPRDVLARNQVSLISRGSEILRRYMHEEAIDPAIMGYSVAGVVERVGAEAAARFGPGDRVAVVAPHAQYVLAGLDQMDGTMVWPLPDDLTLEQATFIPLCTSSIWWAHSAGIGPGDTVVVLGQGLVGNLVMQAARRYLHERLIAVDVLPSRCRLAEELGAEIVVDASREDPVETVRQLTGGAGAEVVIDCVGGKAGLASFGQAQQMTREGGTIQVIGLYHGQPLPLDAGLIQGKTIVGGYRRNLPRVAVLSRAIEDLRAGRLRVDPLVSHRFAYPRAKEAYDLLYDRLSEAMGVLLVWE